MKKGTSIFTVISILCLTLCACNLSLEDTDLLDAPEASPLNNQISIIIPKINNETKYINIFRQESSDTDVKSIGIVFPKAIINKNYFFVDELAVKNRSYKYKVRYCDKSGYRETKWSSQISTKDLTFPHDESETMKYDATGAKFNFDKDDYTLTINGTISEPDFTGYSSTIYKPMIIVSNLETNKSEAIKISSIANHTIIPLRNILPNYFLDTNISIVGIVAQRNVYVDENAEEDKLETMYIAWTEPESITIKGAGSDSILNIPSQLGEAGLDYRSAQ